jgi:hypothetical protein
MASFRDFIEYCTIEFDSIYQMSLEFGEYFNLDTLRMITNFPIEDLRNMSDTLKYPISSSQSFDVMIIDQFDQNDSSTTGLFVRLVTKLIDAGLQQIVQGLFDYDVFSDSFILQCLALSRMEDINSANVIFNLYVSQGKTFDDVPFHALFRHLVLLIKFHDIRYIDMCRFLKDCVVKSHHEKLSSHNISIVWFRTVHLLMMSYLMTKYDLTLFHQLVNDDVIPLADPSFLQFFKDPQMYNLNSLLVSWCH